MTGLVPGLPLPVHRLVAAVLLAASLAAAPAGAQDLEAQLVEIRALVREKRYHLALESLSILARQLQDQRVKAVAEAFPAPGAGWTATPARSPLEDGAVWSSRVTARRSYVATSGTASIELTIDVHTPHGPAVAMSLNPLAVAGDPSARIVDIGGEKGLLRHNADTDETELNVLVGPEVLVTARGRGISPPEVLVNVARGVDYPLLRAKPLP